MALTQSGSLTPSCQSSLISNAECHQITDSPATQNTESTKHFLCKNAIVKLPNNKRIKKYFTENDIDLDAPFAKFTKSNAFDLIEIQKIAKIKWIILKKDKKGLYSLIYDGRFFDFLQDNYKFHIWILNTKGKFV